jgi:hypothetical protein
MQEGRIIVEINLSEFGGIVGALMIVGAVLKNAVPEFPNRLIPLVILILGVASYLALTHGWSDEGQWVAAVVAAATAVGAHSGIKNSLQ